MSQTKTSATRAFWNAYVISKYVFIFKEGQFLFVRAVGRTEKGAYNMGGILSLSVDEDDRQISKFLICTAMPLMF